MAELVVEVGVYGGLVPVVVGIVVGLAGRRLLGERAGTRYAAALAFSAAFCVGYVLLPEWAKLVPQRHWQWLPYLCAIGVLIAGIGLAGGVSRIERAVLHALLAAGAAWLLVPDWSSLEPSRGAYVAFLAGYLFLLAVLVDWLPDRVLGPSFVGLLTLAALAVAILIAGFVSLKYGQVAGLAASGLLGCLVVGLRSRDPTTTRGLAPVFAVAVGGAAFVGVIEPEPPMYGLLLVPAAPLTTWLFAWGPLSRLGAVAGMTARIVAVLVPIGIALALLMIAEQSAGANGY